MFRIKLRPLTSTVGVPVTVGGLVEEYRSPVWATGVGLVLLGAETLAPDDRRPDGRRDRSRGEKGRDAEKGQPIGKLISWLKDSFF